MFKIRDYPYLTLKGRVLFPGASCVMELARAVERESTNFALGSKSKAIAVFTTRVEGDSGLDDLFPVGVLATIKSKASDKVELEVTQRVRLRDISFVPRPLALVEMMEPPTAKFHGQLEDQDAKLRKLATELFERCGEGGRRALYMMEGIREGEYFALVSFLGSTVALPVERGIEILSCLSLEEAQGVLLEALTQLPKGGRTGILHAISWPAAEADSDLDGPDPSESAFRLKEILEELPMNEEARRRLQPELAKLERFDPSIFEHQETFARLEGLVTFPWQQADLEPTALRGVQAERFLDKVILGHRQAKATLLDLLTRLDSGPAAFPLLILTGEPGLGQDTLIESYASVMGLPWEKVTILESSGASVLAGTPRSVPEGTPGAVYNAAVSAGAREFILYLSVRGPIDEAVAQVLADLVDERGSRRFREGHIDLPIDLSGVRVVLAVRSARFVPEWLRERAVVIPLEGYLPSEREAIWEAHLWPAALHRVGLDAAKGGVLEAGALAWLVQERTCESGVTELNQLAQRLAERVSRVGPNGTKKRPLPLARIKEWLGDRVASPRDGASLGVVGQVCLVDRGVDVLDVAMLRLPAIPEAVLESPVLPEVMALALACGGGDRRDEGHGRWHARISPGALDQECESQALALALALRSQVLRFPVACDLAVMGSLGFGGEVLAVGSSLERVLAARGLGYRTLILPSSELEVLEAKIPACVLAGLRLVGVSTFEEAVRAMLESSANRQHRLGIPSED